jgi:glycosyltransferase involved in cell wall biosynthesis
VSSLAILIPVFNDWESVELLLGELDRTATESFRVLLVNDGSTQPVPESLIQVYGSLRRLEVLHLRRNVGHQRAIALGLVHLSRELDGIERVVVMDADGEDQPAHVAQLVATAKANPGKLVFASRLRRLEWWGFLASYEIYRLLHWALTGVPVRIGNFSVIPAEHLERLVVSTELWNHYAATAMRSRLPIETVPLDRGRRYRGSSDMTFSSLVSHGLAAISVFGDVVGARLLFLNAVLLAVVIAGAAAGFLLLHPVPAWFLYGTAAVAVVLGQLLLVMLLLAFVIQGRRSSTAIVPERDCDTYLGEVHTLVERAVRAIGR